MIEPNFRPLPQKIPEQKIHSDLAKLSKKNGIINGFLIEKNNSFERVGIFKFLGEKFFGKTDSKNLKALVANYLINHEDSIHTSDDVKIIKKIAKTHGLTENLTPLIENIEKRISTVKDHSLATTEKKPTDLAEKNIEIIDEKAKMEKIREDLQRTEPFLTNVDKQNENAQKIKDEGTKKTDKEATAGEQEKAHNQTGKQEQNTTSQPEQAVKDTFLTPLAEEALPTATTNLINK